MEPQIALLLLFYLVSVFIAVVVLSLIIYGQERQKRKQIQGELTELKQELLDTQQILEEEKLGRKMDRIWANIKAEIDKDDNKTPDADKTDAGCVKSEIGE